MRIATRFIIGFFLMGLAACGGDSTPAPDTTASNDLGEADSISEQDTGGVTPDEGSGTADEGSTVTDVVVIVDEGPEPVLGCEDPDSIDIAAIQANSVIRLHKMGLGGWDITQNMVCDSTSAADVDNDPTSTFPGDEDVTESSTFSACESGLNNALIALQDLASGFGVDLRTQILESTTSGSINATVELIDNGDGAWTLNFYQTEVAVDNVYDEESGTWSVCNISDAASSPCDFDIDIVSFNEECAPMVSMDATLSAENKLVAGGPDEVFSLALPLEDVGTINLAISAVNVTADVSMAEMQVSGVTNGLLSGVLPREGILDLVNNLLPPDIGVPPALIISLLEGIFDIDTDGDGLNDALSVGLMFEGTPVSILGLRAE